MGSRKSPRWAILQPHGLGRGLWQAVSVWEEVRAGKGTDRGGQGGATVASVLVRPSSPLTS